MNINDNVDRLVYEEQKVLDNLISDMDKEIDALDDRIKGFIQEAKNADISLNPDLYLSHLLARKGIKDTTENRKKFVRARDELYHTRILLQSEDDNGETEAQEVKIGLHSCDGHNSKMFIVSWERPLCRHFVLNSDSTSYESVVIGKHKEEYHTLYKLIVKNKVDLRFTHVKKAINLYPGVIDEESLKLVREANFFSDEYIDQLIDEFDPETFDPDAAAQIIADEFLQELLERRSSPEFKNIVFSIQKKQSEIIQAPYPRSMIVQGCAGSGKSMIMLHRLPIILYDEPQNFKRNNVYIITPSPMYIQMAENMRYQLEISDINMGTIEQYYDYCIEKYASHKASEYGKISYSKKITAEKEKYIYSEECVNDIKEYFAELCRFDFAIIKRLEEILELDEVISMNASLPLQIIDSRVRSIQRITDKNKEALRRYYNAINEILESLRKLNFNLQNRKSNIKREILKRITAEKESINLNQKEIEKLDQEKNIVAINNRKNAISAANANIERYMSLLDAVEADEEYFANLLSLSTKVIGVIKPFETLKNVYSENKYSDIYSAIDNIGQLIGGYYSLSWDFSKLDEKYGEYIKPIDNELNSIQQLILSLQDIKAKYLNYNDFRYISEEGKKALELRNNAIRCAYDYIVEKTGIKLNSKNVALKFSPYLYLQVIYQYQGAPNSFAESLLAIDEAQGVAPEEIRLLKNVNKNNVIFNMYGDIYQHIEGTKGIDSWDDFRGVLEFETYEMQENYRNASQITEYCNSVFGMSMNPINTHGKGVHEIKSEEDFHSEMIRQITNDDRIGIAAILVENKYEADYILDVFSGYEQKFHNMTGDDFGLHHTRWNIINIDDAKGLEFGSVIVLAGKMSKNERYIAYTRALDELFIYHADIDVAPYQEKKSSEKQNEKSNQPTTLQKEIKHNEPKTNMIHKNSEVKTFFESKGLEVIDKRDNGGRLWVVGEKAAIREIVNEAISKFGISGKYISSREIMNRNGWCTKTDK